MAWSITGRGVIGVLRELFILRGTLEPGAPWLNGVGESFNGKLRDDCLNSGRSRSVRPQLSFRCYLPKIAVVLVLTRCSNAN
jgi:transposase InsO family protein